jgi:hypothetical protein
MLDWQKTLQWIAGAATKPANIVNCAENEWHRALNTPIFLRRNVKETKCGERAVASTAMKLQCLQAIREKGARRKWTSATEYEVTVAMRQTQRVL